MAFKMKFSGFKKTNGNEEEFPTRPLKEGEFKPHMGTGPIVGGFGKLFKAFGKIAKSRAAQNIKLKKMITKGGKKYIESPKSLSRGNLFGPKS